MTDIVALVAVLETFAQHEQKSCLELPAGADACHCGLITARRELAAAMREQAREIEHLQDQYLGCNAELGERTIERDSLRAAIATQAAQIEALKVQQVDIVFDGPPGPEPGSFVEVENAAGQSIRFGEWIQRSDGYWVLRFNAAPGSASEFTDGHGNDITHLVEEP